MSEYINFLSGHRSPVRVFLMGLSQLEGIKGKIRRDLSLIECVTFTHVYKGKAF